MKKTRYIIVDKDLGVFLGTYHGSDLGADDDRIYACFAANNPFGLVNACSFKTEAAAKYFINDTFAPQKRPGLKPAAVETDSEFPHVVEIIKSGYGDFTHDMSDMLFEEASPTIH